MIKASSFSEEPVVAISNKREAGAPSAEVRRKHAANSAALHKLTAMFGGFQVSVAK